jgi:hypothetical protein
MKYLKTFENSNFQPGDYAKLTNPLYLLSTKARMNNVTLETVFKVDEILDSTRFDLPYSLSLDNRFFAWVDEKDIVKLTDFELSALKYNL